MPGATGNRGGVETAAARQGATFASVRLAALLEGPHPGLFTWQKAVADARRAEAAERWIAAAEAAAKPPGPAGCP